MKRQNFLVLIFLILILGLIGCIDSKTGSNNIQRFEAEDDLPETYYYLRAAAVEELIDSNMYNDFSNAAKVEGRANIERLFKVLSEAEKIHKTNTYNIANLMMEYTLENPIKTDIQETDKNLIFSIEKENYEIEEMYPDFIEVSKKEKYDEVTRVFSNIILAEKNHSLILEKMTLDNSLEADYYLCPFCGNILVDKLPSECDICKNLGENFIKY